MPLFPNVKVSERIRGPRPVFERSGQARIGVVGTFKKGAYLTYAITANADEFEDKYAKTTDTGSVGVQCALDQGANEFGIVRVMGAARKASRTVRFTGNASATSTIELAVVQSSTTYTATINTTSGMTPAQQATAMAAAVALVSGIPVTAVANPAGDNGALLVTAKVAGAAGNSITVRLIDGSPVSGVTLSPTSATAMTGGADGPAKASVTINDGDAAACLRADAKSEGTWGNSLSIQPIAGAVADTVTLIVTNSDAETERRYENLTFKVTDLVSGTKVKALLGDPDIDLFYVSADADRPLPATGATVHDLAGGLDGSTILDTDYTAALAILENNAADIIMAPGQTSSTVLSALLAQAQNSKILTRLRIAVLNGPQNQDITTVDNTSTGPAVGYAPALGEAVMVLGWCTYAGRPELPEKSVSPDGFYAGHLAATNIEVSPAARSSSRAFVGVTDVDTIQTEPAWEAYTNGRCEAIVLEPASGAYHCLNGRTLATDPAHYYVCFRRVGNKLKSDIYKGGQPLKSEPKRETFIGDMGGFVQNYLTRQVAAGIISDGKLEQVVRTQGGARADYFYVPIPPADQLEFVQIREALPV